MNYHGAYPRLDDQATRRKGHRFMLDVLLALLIIALLIIVFLKNTAVMIEKSRLTGIMAPMFVGRINVLEHHAFTGGWLDDVGPVDEASTYGHAPATRIGAIRQGAIHIQVLNRKKNAPQAPPEWWSIRPAVAADDAPTILWICGSRLPPARFQVFGEDMTTLPPEINFRFCQKR